MIKLKEIIEKRVKEKKMSDVGRKIIEERKINLKVKGKKSDKKV